MGPGVAAAAAVAVQWGGFCWSGHGYLYPIRGCSSHENFLICERNHQLHCPPELQHTLCQMVRLTRDWQLGFLCPVLEGLHIGEGLLWLYQSVVSAAKLQVWRWHELVFLQGPVGWWCRMVIVYPHCTTSSLWHFKWCTYFLHEFPGVIMAQDLLQFLPPDQCVYLSSVSLYPFHILYGRRSGVIECQSLWDGILHSCNGQKHILPTQELLEVGLQKQGTLLIPLLLSPLSTSQNCHASHPQLPRSAGASGRLCPPWHLFPGSPHLAEVPSPLQMSPGASVRLGLETGSATGWYPCGGKLPGGLLPCLWVPHGGRSPRELLDILQTWIICVGSYQSIGSCWNVSGYQSITGWWSSLTVLFYPWAWPLLPGPSGGHPSLWQTSPHMNPLSRLWILHMCSS